jgi:hypothetical protein
MSRERICVNTEFVYIASIAKMTQMIVFIRPLTQLLTPSPDHQVGKSMSSFFLNSCSRAIGSWRSSYGSTTNLDHFQTVPERHI